MDSNEWINLVRWNSTVDIFGAAILCVGIFWLGINLSFWEKINLRYFSLKFPLLRHWPQRYYSLETHKYFRSHQPSSKWAARTHAYTWNTNGIVGCCYLVVGLKNILLWRSETFIGMSSISYHSVRLKHSGYLVALIGSIRYFYDLMFDDNHWMIIWWWTNCLLFWVKEKKWYGNGGLFASLYSKEYGWWLVYEYEIVVVESRRHHCEFSWFHSFYCYRRILLVCQPRALWNVNRIVSQ